MELSLEYHRKAAMASVANQYHYYQQVLQALLFIPLPGIVLTFSYLVHWETFQSCFISFAFRGQLFRRHAQPPILYSTDQFPSYRCSEEVIHSW